MAEIATNFPPQTYSSSFFLNSLADEEKNVSSSEGAPRTENAPLLDCFISTMSVLLLFIFVFLLRDYLLVEGFQCTISLESKTRFFDSIIHYQGNKIPFNSLNATWQGSNVEFNCSKISKLVTNIFITYDSQSIISLKLSGKYIEEIDYGAFTSLICLKDLYLDHNNITKLNKGVFQNLSKLEKLDLSQNKLEVLKDLSFVDLPLLKMLNLANNRIKTLEDLVFNNLSSLEYLNLEQNHISKISQNLFLPLTKLSILILSWNKLWNVEPKEWRGLLRLQKLELAGNNLNHFDPSYNFVFSSLKSLNLSFNALTTLNAVQLRRHFLQLEMLDLNNNPWRCSDLRIIIHEFSDSKIKLFALNSSHNMDINGIACSENGMFSTTIKLTTDVATSSTTGTTELWVKKDELESYVEKKIRDNNINLRKSIESIRTFIIFVFGLLIVYIVIEIMYRTDICKSIVNRVRGGNNLYVDEGDLENFRLLHR